MPIRWITAATVLATVALLVVGVNQLPPLTEGGLPRSGPPPFGAASAPADPVGWCRANLPGVDCGCFAQKADKVMNARHEPLQGVAYVNRWDLALAQADKGC
ncbi:MAG: hypothetical protein KI788_09765 [Mameliella sp.]|nr:hypothetical protein [Mameliella sp.]